MSTRNICNCITFPIGQVESLSVDHWIHNVYIIGDMDKASWFESILGWKSDQSRFKGKYGSEKERQKAYSIFFLVIMLKRRIEKWDISYTVWD